MEIKISSGEWWRCLLKQICGFRQQKWLELLLFPILFAAANSYGEVCEHRVKPRFISIDEGRTARVSVWISKSPCEFSAISIRIHTAWGANRPIYIVDRNLREIFGRRALPFTDKNHDKLANELLDELTDRKNIGDFDINDKCLRLIPEAYLDKLIKNKASMYAFTWYPHASGRRYIAYIPEIEQFVNIASCQKSGA